LLAPLPPVWEIPSGFRAQSPLSLDRARSWKEESQSSSSLDHHDKMAFYSHVTETMRGDPAARLDAAFRHAIKSVKPQQPDQWVKTLETGGFGTSQPSSKHFAETAETFTSWPNSGQAPLGLPSKTHSMPGSPG